jgi:FkbM family methyltransferase
MQKLLLGLLQAGAVPPGSVVDAGAADGTEACSFAAVAPTRLVHALDPLVRNVHAIERLARAGHANLRPMVAALGDEERSYGVPAHLAHHVGQQARWRGRALRAACGRLSRGLPAERMLACTQVSIADPTAIAERRFQRVAALREPPAANATRRDRFEVFRLDGLFDGPWRGERLGLAHLDTEGHELSVLRGAARTLRRDRPLLTLELIHSAGEHEQAGRTRRTRRTQRRACRAGALVA